METHVEHGTTWAPPSRGKVLAALVKAQSEIKGAPKDKDNPYFGSKYADLANIVEAIRAPFAKYGLGFYQDVTSDDASVTCVTTIVHESGETLSSAPLRLPVAQKTPQAFGSASTYARRYSLQAIAGVAAEQDDDGNAGSQAPAAKPPPPSKSNGHPATPQQPTAPKRRLSEEMDQAEPPPAAEIGESRHTRERPSPVTFRFGKRKGATSHEVQDKELVWYRDCARQSVADPDKSQFLESNKRELASLEAEIQWRATGAT